jgi:hypothetical protein
MEDVLPPSRLANRIGVAAASLLVLFYLGLTIWANTDLTAGRFVIFMDEGILFDGVHKILHPAGLRDFFHEVTNGGDQRYGRSLWNVTALIAFLPERLWGDTGLIVTERMVQALLLLSSMLLLTVTHVRSWVFRLPLLLMLLVVPYADYYLTSPKPEPLELLLVAIFLWLHKRRGYGFGWHWIFLGMAFGTKISALPLVLVFAIAGAVQDGRWRDLRLDKAADTLFPFLAGLGLAVPLLLRPILYAAAIYYAGAYFARRANRNFRPLILAAAVGLGAYLGRHQIDQWLDFTFRNTGQAQDQASVNALTWATFFLRDWLVGPPLLNAAFIASAMLLVLWRGVVQGREKGWCAIQPEMILCVAGAAMSAAIFVSAHRIWGFYLMPGMVLMCVGLVATVEDSLAGQKAVAGPMPIISRLAAASCLLLSVLMAAFYWAPYNFKILSIAARRTEDPSYKQEYATFQIVTNVMNSHSRNLGRRLLVDMDPNLFLPADTPAYAVSQFWGRYQQWTGKADLLILGKGHTEAAVPPQHDSLDYPGYVAERADYEKYVVAQGQACREVQCYERIAALPDGGEILMRKPGVPR